MFRRLCGNGWGALSPGEIAATEQLCESRSQLLMDGGFADVKSEAGYTACAAFLTNLDKAARTLCLEVAPRGYRANFSANYRALFPDNARHYRVDVLEASVDQQFSIWVNGERFELSPDAIGHAEALLQAWADLGSFLDRWQAAWASEAQESASRPGRAELAAALVAFDVAWAEFESRYISELIAIEERARQLVVKAVQIEGELEAAERSEGGLDAAEAERQFVRCIAHLNSVANFRRKGRDDLGCDILDRAKAVLQQYEDGKDGLAGGRAKDAARTLAADIIGSYQAMRQYFRKVATCIEHVDPHLCNNAGLVSRLVDWEETWEVGARYVRSAPLLEAVCDLVAEIRAAQQVAPELTMMCEDCDVELFMVLPRIVVLCFLADPLSRRTELVRSLLPHRFSPPAEGSTGAVFMKVDPELKALYDRFKETMHVVSSSQTPATARMHPKAAAWEVVVKQAIVGTEDEEMNRGCPPDARRAVADLLRAVERWSLELQRRCPEDWNQCSFVLVHCLTGGLDKKAPSKFQV